MKVDSLTDIFRSFDQLKVLIVGDVMIDSYLWGNVERISPEAPVPVVNVKRRDKRLGGAANVAVNIQAMGAIPILCSIIGQDVDGDDFLQLIHEQGIPAEGILRSEHRITTIKHRILSGHQHMLRVDSEINSPIGREDQRALLQRIQEILPQCSVVIFEDYDKGILDEVLISQIIQLAQKHKIPTVVDPKKRNFLNYRQATLFKPNLKELREGLKIEVDKNDLTQLAQAVRILRERLEIEQALITLSEQGVYIDKGKESYHIPAHLRSIADVSGAGDTVVSVAALCVALNLPIKFTAALANLAGGLVCEYLGVVSVDKARLLKEATDHNLMPL